MPFNITDFTAELNKGGIARSDFFEVVFTSLPPKVVQSVNRSTLLGPSYFTILDGLRFRADSVTVPQRAITPIEYKDYGAPFKIGSTANYIEIDVTFILSKDMRERNFFLAWQDVIAGDHRLKQTASRGSSFDLGYFDDYKCDGIEIIHYAGDENKDSPSYTTQLRDAYPLNVGPVTRSWASAEIMKQQVTFTYRYFTEKPSGSTGAQLPPEAVGSGGPF